MAKGAGRVDATPNKFFQFFARKGKAFISNKVFSCSIILVTSFHQRIFPDRTSRLGSKIRQKEGAWGWQPSPPWTFFLSNFLTKKMTFNPNKFGHGVK